MRQYPTHRTAATTLYCRLRQVFSKSRFLPLTAKLPIRRKVYPPIDQSGFMPLPLKPAAQWNAFPFHVRAQKTFPHPLWLGSLCKDETARSCIIGDIKRVIIANWFVIARHANRHEIPHIIVRDKTPRNIMVQSEVIGVNPLAGINAKCIRLAFYYRLPK